MFNVVNPFTVLRRRGSVEVGIGTVRAVDGPITLEVECASGRHFVGSLRGPVDDSGLRPGVLLLVTFDPARPTRLSLADDMTAVLGC